MRGKFNEARPFHCQMYDKERMVDMALNGSGARDTARVMSVAIGDY